MDAALRLGLAAVAALPPPPEPGGGEQDGGLNRTLLVAIGLLVAALLVFALGLLLGRRRSRRPAPTDRPVTGLRVELWRDGEALVLGYAGDPAGGDPVFARQLALLRTIGVHGTLALIDPGSDEIVTLAPVEVEPARPHVRSLTTPVSPAPLSPGLPEAPG